MERIVTTLRTVTPMFIGGSEPETRVDLRVPSIKGALRFWYRALDPDYRANEARIFGGAGQGEGQSSFILQISNLRHPPKSDPNDGEAGDARWDKTSTAYLGYGVIVRDSRLRKSITTRPYVRMETSFSLSFQFKPRARPEDVASVRKALWALVMLGGLGARSRKGFGSLLAIEKPVGMDGLPTMQPRDSAELAKSLASFFQSLKRPSQLPEYTAWSTKARCVIAGNADNGKAALEWLGGQMHACRSWKGIEKSAWVTTDHDLMREFISGGGDPKVPPLRSAFGLPHNYFFTSLGNKKGGVDLMDNKTPGRRASPLIFHIHEFPGSSGKNKACVVATYLPAQLVPRGQKVRMSREGKRSILVDLPNDFKAVTDFVNRLSKLGMEVSP